VGVLMAELQGAWNDEDRKQALKVLTGATAVALDDFDKVNPSPSMLAQLFTALDKREQARSPLLVTTNLKPSDLASKLGNVIASRLTGMCVVLAYPGPDRRLEIGRD
jgi:DNA replication protein DnaC